MDQVAWTERRAKGLVWFSFEGWHGVRCLHSTRVGGVSPAPFDTLNMSESVGDLKENVEENRRRFGAVACLDVSKVILNQQVHGNKVNLARDSEESLEGDALLTDQQGISLGVSVADCLPVYVYDRAQGAIGLIHAGRKGTLQGIVRKTILHMGEELGARPDDCCVLFGPAIGPCCYRVGSEIAREFENQWPGSTVRPYTNIGEAGSGPFVDLWKANELQLSQVGVREISNARLCTSCRGDLFFSHRRDGGKTGRMLAIIERVGR